MRSDGAAMHQLCRAPRHKQSQEQGVSAGVMRQRAAMPMQLMSGQTAAGTGPASDPRTERITAAERLQSDTAIMTRGRPATAG